MFVHHEGDAHMTDSYELSDQELDSIRELAYDKFVARGCEDGHDMEDWLAAEQEVRNGRTEAKSSVHEPAGKKGRRSSHPSETATVG